MVVSIHVLGLFAKDEQIHFFGFVSDRETARQELSKFRRKPDGGALIIAGDSLKVNFHTFANNPIDRVC